MLEIYCPYCTCGVPENVVSDWQMGDGDHYDYECEGCGKKFRIRAYVSIDYDVEQLDCLNDGCTYTKKYLDKNYPSLYNIGKAVCTCCYDVIVFDEKLNKEALALALNQALLIRNPVKDEIKELLERNEISFQNWLKTKKED